MLKPDMSLNLSSSVRSIYVYTNNDWLFKRYPRFTDGIYWEAGLFLTTPFTEGCEGVSYQTLPLAARICCTFSPTTFSSVLVVVYLPSVSSVQASLDPLRSIQFSDETCISSRTEPLLDGTVRLSRLRPASGVNHIYRLLPWPAGKHL